MAWCLSNSAGGCFHLLVSAICTVRKKTIRPLAEFSVQVAPGQCQSGEQPQASQCALSGPGHWHFRPPIVHTISHRQGGVWHEAGFVDFGLASCSREFPRLRARNAPTWPSLAEAQGTKPGVTDLDYGQGPGQSSRCFHLRQTETGRAGFIASSKNKTWKQTIVLSESDVYLSRCASNSETT